ncbi:uncharacterized protein EDB91DRAFT_1162148 [Suillus paluster]|uniref:uncharacterized protein n=1 Tax=Suillus paluster TaxID=48578 RepID=UPI001B86C6CB|nr:uncharacterized protein EDB91DRAFT_1162148 [Suillus paluster]KAG1728392.1 hypothetical protein EDB91DRAFT_1162148 [Suillus paluster]
MKFAWLTTLIASAALMTGVAIASEDLTTNPQNQPCNNANRAGCSHGIKGFNNGNDFGYFCGSNGKIASYETCQCHNCCLVVNGGDGYICGLA